jgi:DNA-binding PadR family transcriptional regulator
MKKLSPTSYVLLALLARAPHSAYELNTRMQRSILTAFWPRAESHVYSEPKKLLKEGLVAAKREEVSGRLRTVYNITQAGRSALESWLQSPTESYAAIHYEAMLKFLCADSGSIDTLKSNVQAITEGALREARLIEQEIDNIRTAKLGLDGMPYNAMAVNFLLDIIEARLNWANTMQQALQDFATTQSSAATAEQGEHFYQLAHDRLKRLLDEHS